MGLLAVRADRQVTKQWFGTAEICGASKLLTETKMAFLTEAEVAAPTPLQSREGETAALDRQATVSARRPPLVEEADLEAYITSAKRRAAHGENQAGAWGAADT